MNKLEPCPFCGEPAIGTNDEKYVYCYTPGCAMYSREAETEQWNTRAPDQRVARLVEAAKDYLACLSRPSDSESIGELRSLGAESMRAALAAFEKGEG